MAIEKILPDFKTEEEKLLVMCAIGLPLLFAGYLSFLPPLVVYMAFSEKLTFTSKEIIRKYLNFMLTVFIAMLVLTISVIGKPFAVIIGVFALIVLIINVIAIVNNTELTMPVYFDFIKNPDAVSDQSKVSKKDEELKP